MLLIGRRVSLEHALYGGRRNAVASGDLADTLAALAILLDRGSVQHQGSSADSLAVQTGTPHAGADSFDDERPFQLGDSADDHDDGAAQRSAGVDLFPEADELDSDSVELVEHIQEVLHRPGDSVASPDQDNIEPAAAGIGHHLIEPGPLGLRAAELVRVLGDDLVPPLSGHLSQVEKLCLRMLIDRRDAHVERGALHARLPFGLGANPYLAT